MRSLVAIVSFIVAAVLLGLFGFCIFQAISDLGVVLAVHEIIGGWDNVAILGGCLLFGGAFFITGVAVLVTHPESAR
jgi:hypothetical protein